MKPSDALAKARIGTLVRAADGRSGIVIPAQSPGLEGATSVALLSEAGVAGSVVTSNGSAFSSEWKMVLPKQTLARVVIMADMEGITGVPNDEAAVTPAEETGGVRTPAYAASCRAMTLDVLHAIAGARAAGAQEIIVADTHWHDTNFHARVEHPGSWKTLRGVRAQRG